MSHICEELGKYKDPYGYGNRLLYAAGDKYAHTPDFNVNINIGLKELFIERWHPWKNSDYVIADRKKIPIKYCPFCGEKL